MVDNKTRYVRCHVLPGVVRGQWWSRRSTSRRSRRTSRQSEKSQHVLDSPSLLSHFTVWSWLRWVTTIIDFLCCLVSTDANTGTSSPVWEAPVSVDTCKKMTDGWCFDVGISHRPCRRDAWQEQTGYLQPTPAGTVEISCGLSWLTTSCPDTTNNV